VTRPYRFTRLYYRTGWRVWKTAAHLFRSPRREQTFLSVFGPLSLLILFALWAAGLIFGFGLIHHGIAPREAGLWESIYLSGTTFTTLGYGDVTPTTPLARTLAVTEAAMGLGFFAVVIGYLPVLGLVQKGPILGNRRARVRVRAEAADTRLGCEVVSCVRRVGSPTVPPSADGNSP
jgi:hypothetical protein